MVRGNEPVLMRGSSKNAAERARALIEDRTTRSDGQTSRPSPPASYDAEHLMRTLVELRDAVVQSEEEFEAKRAEVTAQEEKRR